jgi:MFS family permease
VFNWFASVAGSLLSERVGRRKLWLGATAGMLASFIVLTACSAVYAEKGVQAAGTTVLAFLFVFYGFYAVGVSSSGLAQERRGLP